MEVISAGRDALAIFIDDSELTDMSARGEITACAAARILKLALGEAADPRWERASIELFPGRGSTLLLARIPPDEPRYFAFGSFEALLSAARACPYGVASQLTYLDGSYVLTVYPDGGALLPPLLEYGAELRRPASFADHLGEHGTPIAGPHALDTLRSSFSG